MEHQETNPVPNPARKRPVFLTILCLLSFAGIAFVIATSLNNLTIIPAGEKMIEDHTANGSSFFEYIDVKGIDNYIGFYRVYNICCIVASIVCLSGVILMWKLRRVGFYLYVVGEIAPVLVFFILFGRDFQNPLLSLKFMTSALLMFLVAVAFIVMYAMNYKRMS